MANIISRVINTSGFTLVIKYINIFSFYFFFCRSLTSLKTLQTLQIFGLLTNPGLSSLKERLPSVDINGIMFTTVARPTETQYKKRIWGMKCRGHGD